MSVYLQVQKLLRQKQLEIEDFSVYWDTKCEMLGKLAINEIQVSNGAAAALGWRSFTAVTVKLRNSNVFVSPEPSDFGLRSSCFRFSSITGCFSLFCFEVSLGCQTVPSCTSFSEHIFCTLDVSNLTGNP